MIDESKLNERLPIGLLGEPNWFFPTIGSTNDQAKELAEAGAPHGSLLVAEEQTAGRGRGDHHWSTPAGSALAMSLILRPAAMQAGNPLALNVLGALSVAESIEAIGGRPQIKWPNDVLLEGKKVAGVLVEAAWREDALEYAVIGMGVNVRPAAVPPAAQLSFPAASVEGVLGETVDRAALLLSILRSMDYWLSRMDSASLLQAWQERMAYLGRMVEVEGAAGSYRGVLQGVTQQGQLRLESEGKGVLQVGADFHRLRPVDSDPR